METSVILFSEKYFLRVSHGSSCIIFVKTVKQHVHHHHERITMKPAKRTNFTLAIGVSNYVMTSKPGSEKLRLKLVRVW
jgi:hypothetical protein